MKQKSNKNFLLLFLSLFFMLHHAWSQTKTITGKITDEAGKAVAGASVRVSGSAKGTVSDESGSFSIAVPSSAKTLIVSYVGYKDQELSLKSETNFSVKLVSSGASTLNDVVVVGYGTARRKDVTGAVSSISS